MSTVSASDLTISLTINDFYKTGAHIHSMKLLCTNFLCPLTVLLVIYRFLMHLQNTNGFPSYAFII